jgi:hypothetical protein
MFSSGSNNTSWEYIPPKKLQTTLLSDSPRTLTDLDNSIKVAPQGKFRTIVTPKDCTRANSPLHMSSVLFSDYEENEEIRTLFEQLILVRDRHATLKTYVNSIRAQLQQSFNLAIAELQGKRNLLISQVDLLYDENFSKLCNSHKEKERKIQDKDEELQSKLDEIENAIQKIEGSSLDFEEIEHDINRTLKIWVSENEVNGEWAEIKVPDFSYLIIPAEEFKKSETAKRNTSRCSRKHKNHRHEHPCKLSTKNRSFERMLKQNTDMADRLNILEGAVSTTLKPPRPEKHFDSKFDLGQSESPITISTLYSDESRIEDINGRLRVYVPHGYPAYTCFYLIKVSKDITVKQVSEKLSLHMGMGKSKCVFKVKDGEKMKKVDENEKAYHLVKYKICLEKF